MTNYQKDILVGTLFVASILFTVTGVFLLTVISVAGIIYTCYARNPQPIES
ncbi:hypothetical protein [Methyloprofundus sp.]|uniref:hypothetical protein n=1 Tax=Methyloprofundus sp. TaxID=2020875 RepID=UPI003D136411